MTEKAPQEKTVKIAAFGALNEGSYDEFWQQIVLCGLDLGIAGEVSCAGPYPNAEAVSVPGRPLRGDALKGAAKKEELYKAVAQDAREAGAETADYRCMPCMSMIGFHEGVEKALGLPIFPLAPALAAAYAEVPRLGVIHMRPAQKRIEEIFGDKAVTPDAAQAAKLLAAEEAAKQAGDPAAVEAVMREITEEWRDAGLTEVLFARADAPAAKKSAAGKVEGVRVLTYFDILAGAILRAAQNA
ncbi:MAG: hypothetical protein GC185_01180 [Alphaproteobacteria bacterium]|nr:hypothetical protein [Alphaproteobacteria bacterium]